MCEQVLEKPLSFLDVWTGFRVETAIIIDDLIEAYVIWLATIRVLPKYTKLVITASKRI